MGNIHSFTSSRLAIWPTLPLGVHFRKDSDWRPFPLDQENCRLYSLARHALWSASRALGLGAEDIILVPAYHHGSEVEALLQAGLQVRYYEVSDALEPEPEALEDLLDQKVKALYLIHYLGFPQDASHWRQWCDEHNLLLIEDAAQSFLATCDNRPVGSFGHMAIFCLYKMYGVPDGGAVISVKPPAVPAMAAASGYWRMLKRHLNWLAARRGEAGILHLFVKPLFTWLKRLNAHPHAEFDVGNPGTPPSHMTSRLLPKILDEETASRRRENYAFLLTQLGDMVPKPFASLPEGACPFAFPIEVSDARAFLGRLHRTGILGLLFWANPHPSLPVQDFPRSRALRERVLALPVHQELRKSDLNKIVEAVRECHEPKAVTVATAG